MAFVQLYAAASPSAAASRASSLEKRASWSFYGRIALTAVELELQRLGFRRHFFEGHEEEEEEEEDPRHVPKALSGAAPLLVASTPCTDRECR